MAIYLPHRKGLWAEKAARTFLEARGLRLIAHNFSTKMGEIDLIMQDHDETLVFVEVRSRTRSDYGNALESINETKINKLKRTATLFLQQKGWLFNKNSRFDVIAIDIDQHMQIEWVKNAF